RMRVREKLTRAVARGNEVLRRRNEEYARAAAARGTKAVNPPGRGVGLRAQMYILENLDALTGMEGLAALHLGLFYFSGAYYHVAKRVWGLRYVGLSFSWL